MDWNPLRLPDLAGRVYAVTGATAGIGYFAAEQLASAGAEVILVSRSPEKIDTAAASIREQVPSAVTASVAFDLTSLSSIRTGARRLAAVPHLDGVFLNGGPMGLSARATTQDGLPLMIGGHAVANFALIAGLLAARIAPVAERPLRIVHASTGFVQQFAASPRGVRHAPRTGVGAYTAAKALTEAFAYELDRRSRAGGVAISSIVTRPGVGVDAKTPHRAGIRDATVAYRRNPYTPWTQGKDAAAWSGVRALTDPRAMGGEFYGPRRISGPPIRLVPSRRTSAPAPDVIERLWKELEELSGTSIAFPGAHHA